MKSMTRISIVAALLGAILLLDGCVDLTQNKKGSLITFTTSTGEVGTKTVYGDDFTGDGSTWQYIDWLSGDQIQIVSDYAVSPTGLHYADYRLDDISRIANTHQSQATATPTPNGLTWGDEQRYAFYAVYPTPGTGNQTVTITVPYNYSTGNKNYTITVTPNNTTSAQVTATISQNIATSAMATLTKNNNSAFARSFGLTDSPQYTSSNNYTIKLSNCQKANNASYFITGGGTNTNPSYGKITITPAANKIITRVVITYNSNYMDNNAGVSTGTVSNSGNTVTWDLNLTDTTSDATYTASNRNARVSSIQVYYGTTTN